jgi:hypothetical protein
MYSVRQLTQRDGMLTVFKKRDALSENSQMSPAVASSTQFEYHFRSMFRWAKKEAGC